MVLFTEAQKGKKVTYPLECNCLPSNQARRNASTAETAAVYLAPAKMFRMHNAPSCYPSTFQPHKKSTSSTSAPASLASVCMYLYPRSVTNLPNTKPRNACSKLEQKYSDAFACTSTQGPSQIRKTLNHKMHAPTLNNNTPANP
jgi:hypothetical protein